LERKPRAGLTTRAPCGRAAEATHTFTASDSDWGFSQMAPYQEIEDPASGFLADGALTARSPRPAPSPLHYRPPPAPPTRPCAHAHMRVLMQAWRADGALLPPRSTTPAVLRLPPGPARMRDIRRACALCEAAGRRGASHAECKHSAGSEGCMARCARGAPGPARGTWVEMALPYRTLPCSDLHCHLLKALSIAAQSLAAQSLAAQVALETIISILT